MVLLVLYFCVCCFLTLCFTVVDDFVENVFLSVDALLVVLLVNFGLFGVTFFVVL